MSKRKMLLKAILEEKDLYEALFDFVLQKYGKTKKRLKAALESGNVTFITYTEMPIEHDEAGRYHVNSFVVEIFSKDEDDNGGLRKS